MKHIDVVVTVVDSETKESVRQTRRFTEFNLRASRVPEYVALETQGMVNALLDFINEE